MNLKVAGLFTYIEPRVPRSLTMFSPGVNAFFGDNGSGKSYILENLLGYVLGHRPALGGPLLRLSDVNIRRAEGEFENHEIVARTSKSASNISRQFEHLLLETEFFDPREDNWPASPALPGTFEPAPVTDANLEILREVAEYGYVLLEPLRRTPGTWAAWPFAFPTSDTPALQQEVDKWNEFFRVMSALDDAWTDDEDVNDRLFQQEEDEWDARPHLRSSLLANSKTAEILNLREKFIGYDAAGGAFLRSLGLVQADFQSGIYVDGIEPRITGQIPSPDITSMTKQVIDSIVRMSSDQSQQGYESTVDEIRRVASFLTLTAREVLGHLLIDPIPIELRIGDAEEIWRGEPFSWGYEERFNFVPLRDLSTAQRRWSTFAIYLTLRSWLREHPKPWSDEGMATEMWFFDEPERGLHRQAEEHLARGLPTLASRFDAQAFLATHSPEIINHPEVGTFHTKRRNDEVFTRQVQRLHANQFSSLATLGIRPSDLLNRVNLFVLVEGEHEKVLFETFFGTEFSRHRIQLLVARGASNFDGIFDSQLISRFSDARVLLTIDNQSATEIQQLWNQARELTEKRGIGDAQAFLKEHLPAGRKAENKFLREFMIAAIRSKEFHRIDVYGFTREDIIEYLPVTSFASKDSWAELRQDWRDSRSDQQFKPWLEKVHGSKFDSGSLKLAAMSMDDVPTEFGEFLSLALSLADGPVDDVSVSDFQDPLSPS